MKDQIKKDVRVSIKRVHFMEGFLSSHIQYELRYLCVSKIYTYTIPELLLRLEQYGNQKYTLGIF